MPFSLSELAQPITSGRLLFPRLNFVLAGLNLSSSTPEPGIGGASSADKPRLIKTAFLSLGVLEQHDESSPAVSH